MRWSAVLVAAVSVAGGALLTDAAATPHHHTAPVIPVVSMPATPRGDVALPHPLKPAAKPAKHQPAPKHHPKPDRGQGRLMNVRVDESTDFTEHRRWLRIDSCTTRRDYCRVTDTNPHSPNLGVSGYAIGEDLGLTVLTPQQSCIPSLSTSALCVYPAHH